MIGKKILIFNPFGIGDVLFTTPLIRNLKENLKGASLSYLCNRRVYPLLRSNRFLDNVFIFEKDEWKDTLKKSKLTFVRKAASFFRQIKKEKFDIAFDLSLNSQYGFFLKMAGIKQRIGFNFKQRGRFLTHKIDIPDGYNSWHVARYYLTLLKFLEITPREYNFDLFISQDVYDSARRIFEKNGLKAGSLIIAVCPGSGDSWRSSAYFKRWPEENFLKLCNRLQKELKAKIALFGSNVELSLCDYLYKNLEERPLNLCAKISLEQFCALLSLCRLLITNDGGPFHIAQALGKKAIVFFGPVDEKVYGPYPGAQDTVVLSRDIPCRPCYRRFKFNGCQFDKKCLRDIEVGEAFLAAQKLL